MNGMSWRDDLQRYGTISRLLHWGMAALFAWQFTSALLRVFADDTPVQQFFWSTHVSVGVTLWLLVLLRGAWGMANLRRRPVGEGPPLLRHAATIGHFALYALMLVVPSLALLRAAGGGRGLSVYGIQIVAHGGEPVPSLTAPANAAHGLLGWALLALVLGHVAMALWHGFVRDDGTLARMAGSPAHGSGPGQRA